MTNKLKYFVGNWKMFGDFKSYKIVNSMNKSYKNIDKKAKNNKIILCVPNILISYFKKK